MIFTMFTNIIKAQNTVLLKQLAKDFNRSEDVLLNKYLKPELYLPVIVKTLHHKVNE